MSNAQAPISDHGLRSMEDIQGDPVQKLPKSYEDFVFFLINDAGKFRKSMPEIIKRVVSGKKVKEVRQALAKRDKSAPRQPLRFMNIGFSQKGLKTLGINDDLGDEPFKNGQRADAQSLGDIGTMKNGKFDPDWDPEFKEDISGVFLVAAESKPGVAQFSAEIQAIVKDSVTIKKIVHGASRDDEFRKHEHFGWLDGISNPAIKGVTEVSTPGQFQIPAGVILLGGDGDLIKRPEWAHDGSFLVFRKIAQLVPEFKKFIDENPVILPGLSREDGSKLRGAQFFGRWPSGASLQQHPTSDPGVAVGSDVKTNNNFDYPADQERCPFSAHARKMNPRSTLAINRRTANSIIRSGIPYGEDAKPDETTTVKDRGLAFACYQSNIELGFKVQQIHWANSKVFPENTPQPPGFDPIIGQNSGNARETTEISGKSIPLPQEFVKSRGGEYFFLPPLSALEKKFS